MNDPGFIPKAQDRTHGKHSTEESDCNPATGLDASDSDSKEADTEAAHQWESASQVLLPESSGEALPWVERLPGSGVEDVLGV